MAKMENRSQSKYKDCLSIMMFLFIKQHLRTIISRSIHEKVKKHLG